MGAAPPTPLLRQHPRDRQGVVEEVVLALPPPPPPPRLPSPPPPPPPPIGSASGDCRVQRLKSHAMPYSRANQPSRASVASPARRSRGSSCASRVPETLLVSPHNRDVLLRPRRGEHLTDGPMSPQQTCTAFIVDVCRVALRYSMPVREDRRWRAAARGADGRDERDNRRAPAAAADQARSCSSKPPSSSWARGCRAWGRRRPAERVARRALSPSTTMGRRARSLSPDGVWRTGGGGQSAARPVHRPSPSSSSSSSRSLSADAAAAHTHTQAAC